MRYVGNSVISEGKATCYSFLKCKILRSSLGLISWNVLVSSKALPEGCFILIIEQIGQPFIFVISFSGSLLMDRLLEMHSVVLLNLQLLDSSRQFSSQAYKNFYLNYLARKYDIRVDERHKIFLVKKMTLDRNSMRQT